MMGITIIGGGLAGLTLGIALRQRAIPVTVWEAGRYPRHRVCGEFISGRGQAALSRLGLEKEILHAGAIQARNAAFFSGAHGSPVRRLPVPALCLSRFTLDALLAERFRNFGGELKENRRWSDQEFGPGIVRATGRKVQPVEGGYRWFGLKAHARNVTLIADLEMHVVPGGYIGVCRLPSSTPGSSISREEVNVCGLFRSRAAIPGLAQEWPEILRGSPGSQLRVRLSEAVFDPASFCAVAGLPLRAQRTAARGQCRVGDALTMIPPVTGNGMSMAFESAEMALGPLTAFSRGDIPWAEAVRRVARACDTAFSPRLAWAEGLQRMMFLPLLRGSLGAWALRSDRLWRFFFDRTRS